MAQSFPVSGPVFGILCVAEDPPTVIYAGGGGSSKTGVGNSLVVAQIADSVFTQVARHDTGAELCSSIAYGDGILVACFGAKFRCFSMVAAGAGAQAPPTQFELVSEDHVAEDKDSLNGVALSGGMVATGGDDGVLRLWLLPEPGARVEGTLWTATRLFVCKGHEAAITSVDFVKGGHLVCSSSKDGSCRVWSAASGVELCVLPTARGVPPPPPPPKQRNPRARKPDNTIMCRSCIFGGDAAEGLVVYTSQSATRGLGYATKWTLADEGGGGALELTGTAAVVRQVSKHPVSSMLVDGGHVVCGNVEGVVSVWTADLAPRLRSSAHDLPVTCMATLQGAAVVLSASADGKLVATSTTPRPMPLFIKLIIFLLFVATCLVAAQQFLL
ncbi:WD40-repeat-containing domain protein [Pelagophyceae sp. CCMP2097]|nr:WD40-repeat-containing domain protein [Pelagophyceae sp. CCMP2097]|mmetsp:Transcript_6943/g.24473  ORF Transcript_6943/g.24473 Transcript_6943/m.24473 type:complete len:386 (+) Transcript_6943:70-1227(+)